LDKTIAGDPDGKSSQKLETLKNAQMSELKYCSHVFI
jgi:hypothetical protein